MLSVPGGTTGTMTTEKIFSKTSICFFTCSHWKMYVLSEKGERNPGQTSFTCWHGSFFVYCFMINHCVVPNWEQNILLCFLSCTPLELNVCLKFPEKYPVFFTVPCDLLYVCLNTECFHLDHSAKERLEICSYWGVLAVSHSENVPLCWTSAWKSIISALLKRISKHL